MVGATADASANAPRTSVFQLAWPVMVSNLLQTLTTTVDLIMVGSLGAEAPAAVAAVGFGAQFIFLFFSVMISVSAGTIALVARAIGANDFAQADHVLKQSLVLGALLSFPLTLFGVVFAEPMLAAFGAESDVVSLGGAYLRIISLVVFFQFIGFLGSAALRGAGDTVTPLWIRGLVHVVDFGINVNRLFGKACRARPAGGRIPAPRARPRRTDPGRSPARGRCWGRLGSRKVLRRRDERDRHRD